MGSLFYLFFFLLTACGKTTGPNGDVVLQKFILRATGYYRASLVSLNSRTGKVSGRASFYINQNQFYAKVNLQTPWKEVNHLQMVHENDTCPTMKDDLNHDGFLDATESLAVTGGVLLPLDYDISTQMGKFNVVPITGSKGKYLYSQSVSTRTLMEDLWSKDRDLLDFIVKLPRGEELDLQRRVVMIYGVPQRIKPPATVEAFGVFPSYLSLPVACAVIVETPEIFP